MTRPRLGLPTLARAGAPSRREGADLLVDVREAEYLMRVVGVAMFLLGSSALLATLSLPDPNRSDHPAIKLIAALLGLGAVLMLLVRPGRRWLSRAAVIYGILLVSALMAVTRPLEATPFFYLWPMVFSAYFFSRREVAFDLLLMWVTLGIAVFVWSTDPVKAEIFVGVGVSVTVTTIIVVLLAERLNAVIEQLASAAATDYLTGLLNRRAFDEEFRHQVERAERSGLPLTLAMLDIDRFKQVNDRLGHAAGDRALQSFAALLKRELRGGDTLARVGGEEFAVVLFGIELDEAIAFTQRIGARICELHDDELPGLSASAGLASLSEDAPDPETILVLADRALYAAKDAGRRRVAVWSQGATRVAGTMDGLDPVPSGAA